MNGLAFLGHGKGGWLGPQRMICCLQIHQGFDVN